MAGLCLQGLCLQNVTHRRFDAGMVFANNTSLFCVGTQCIASLPGITLCYSQSRAASPRRTYGYDTGVAWRMTQLSIFDAATHPKGGFFGLTSKITLLGD
jgi:hypothetical protein